MNDFELETEYEDDDYLSQFIDEEEVKKVSKIIEEEELEDTDFDQVSDWFSSDYKNLLESSRRKNRAKTFSNKQDFTSDIIDKESGGNYRATNPNSSAAGKYQFLWNTWGDKIAEFTGVRSKQEFLNNPEAQDDFYNNYYLPNELLPAVKRLKRKGFDMDTDSLSKLIHFRGEQGAYDYLTGKISDKPEAYNMRISDYIKQTGGYAQIGINNAGYPVLEQNTYSIPNNNQGYVPITPQPIANPLDMSGYGNTLGGQQENFNSLVNPDPVSKVPVAGMITQGIQERDSEISNAINTFSTLNNVSKDLKDFAAKTISKGTSLANIALNTQSAKQKRLKQMELQNLEYDKYNANSPLIKNKSVL